MEGAWGWRHEDPLAQDEELLPGPDEKRPGAQSVCKPCHHQNNGTETLECFQQCFSLDCLRLCW